MRICVIGKYPPIEGGVSALTYWTCHLLARAGHEVHVVTNADETEPEHRQWLLDGDAGRLEAAYGSGSVRVSFTQAYHDDDLYYIPAGRPTITRLVSVALEVVRRHRCDLLIGWYLEPYVMATSLVAAWTGRPYLLHHAGSDLYDLAAQPELGPAYREAIRAAAGVVSTVVPVEGLGMPAQRNLGYPGLFLPTGFTSEGSMMDIQATARRLRERGCPSAHPGEPLAPGTAVIGAYGKLGVSKGTLDLVAAVARARAAGHAIALALVGAGRGWPGVVAAIREAGLLDVTTTLPALAPWHIPDFIRACTAVAYLERDFEVPQHRPVPPIEVLACGRPLLLSADVLPRVLPGPRDPVSDAIEVVDPRDPEALTAAVTAVIGRRRPSRAEIAHRLRDDGQIAAWYTSAFERVLGRPPGAANPLAAAYAASEAGLARAVRASEDPDPVVRHTAQRAIAEHHALWCRVDVESAAGIPAFPVPVRRLPVLPRDRDALAACYPVASTWLRIAEFEVDAFAYLESGAVGDPAVLPSGQRQILLFHKAPNLTHTISRISPALRDLLAASDGTWSLREYADAIGAVDDRLDRLLDGVRRLHRPGVLMFRREPVS